jgi:hypothetical protein
VHPAGRARLPHGVRLRDRAYFRTGTEFLPILVRQRDHARDHGQADRAALLDGLIQRAETGPATTDTGRS